MNNKLIIMIGIPGSGKSTVVKDIINSYSPDDYSNFIVLSSDDIRKELYGFEKQSNPAEVFGIMNKRCKKALKSGLDVIYDATNISRKRRESLIKEMNSYCEKTVAYMILCPIEELIERNITRKERHLPEEKLWQMIKSIQVPIYQEGFDSICLVKTSEQRDYAKNLLNIAQEFNQENPFHNETLGSHLETTKEYIESLGDNDLNDMHIMIQAAKWHDLGKLYTKEYREDLKRCTFYGHEHVSEYIYYLHCKEERTFSLLRKSDSDIAALISYHMAFYNGNMDKIRDKLGDKLYNLLEVLHEADKFRR